MDSHTFSFFSGGIKSIVPTKSTNLDHIYKLISSERYKDVILEIEATLDKIKINELKSKLDYFVVSGLVEGRRASKNIQHRSGLLCLDFDNITDLESIKKTIRNDTHIKLCFISPSGKGLKIIIKTNTEDFAAAWTNAAKYFEYKYNLIADPSGKDIARACYISYDEDAFYNSLSSDLEIGSHSKKTIDFSKTKGCTHQTNDLSKAHNVVQRILNSGTDITIGYKNWLQLGFALAYYGESGRELFHQISSLNPAYDKNATDEKYTDCLKTSNFSSPAYFFKQAKESGISISKRTSSEIERDAITKKDSFLKNANVYYNLENYEITIIQNKGAYKVSEGFLVYIKYQTRDEKDRISWLIEIKLRDEQAIFVSISHDDLFDSKAIEKIFGAYKLSFSLNTGQLQSLRKFLFECTEFYTAKSVLRYGLEPESELYFFSNVAITKQGHVLEPNMHGIIQHNNNYYKLPNYHKGNASTFLFANNKVSFNTWYSLFHQAQGDHISLFATSFLLFSIFRDIGIQVNNISPMLFISGVAGSGKSTTFIHLNYLFGADGKGMGVNLKGKNTEAAVVAKMEQRHNGFQFADEYTPNHTLTPLFQASYDNKAYSKLNQFADNHIETIDLVPKCTLGFASNFLPELPSDEPFFSRLVLLINNNRKPSQQQKNAYKQLVELEQKGITSVLKQVWSYRDHVKDEFKATYEFLKSQLEARLYDTQLTNHRYLYNVAQLLCIPFILAKRNLITITDEVDILSYFIEHGQKAILTSEELVKEKSILTEFFGVVQEMLDKNVITHRNHYRIDGQQVTIDFRSVYSKFVYEFKRLNRFDATVPSKSSITQALSDTLKTPQNELFKKLSFLKEDDQRQRNFSREGIIFTRDFLENNFNLKFPEN